MAKRQENDYFEMLKGLAAYCMRAALALQGTLQQFDVTLLPQQLQEMHTIEHEADQANHDLHDHLVREFITPIERDDITVMASRIDDITDAIEDVLLRVYMFNVRELRDEMLPFVELIVRCTQALQDGLQEFANFRKSKTVREKIIEINNLEDEGDRLYLTAMRRLFADGATAEEKLVWTELFDCCELCCDACEDVSDAMSRVIMNNT